MDKERMIGKLEEAARQAKFIRKQTDNERTNKIESFIIEQIEELILEVEGCDNSIENDKAEKMINRVLRDVVSMNDTILKYIIQNQE